MVRSRLAAGVRVVIPIAGRDFDPTEVAVPWQILRAAGHEVAFATPDGARGRADELMLTGEGLDPWGFIPWPAQARGGRHGAARRSRRPRRVRGAGARPVVSATAAL